MSEHLLSPGQFNLLPCPFCDSKELRVHLRTFNGIDLRLLQVECGNCGVYGPPHMDGDGENRVAQFWNKRIVRVVK